MVTIIIDSPTNIIQEKVGNVPTAEAERAQKPKIKRKTTENWNKNLKNNKLDLG